VSNPPIFQHSPEEVEPYLPTEDEILSSENKRDSRTKDDAERDALDNETALKIVLAFKTFRFMEGFVSLICVFLIYYICYFAWFRKEIPETVIIALITTSLASIVGLVGFILKGLFVKS